MTSTPPRRRTKIVATIGPASDDPQVLKGLLAAGMDAARISLAHTPEDVRFTIDAWASAIEHHEAWRERVAAAGAHVTPVIDRFWFRSIYFREPSGVLFEIASIGPGFDVDEPLEHLGETLVLPPRFEPMRPQIERVLTPL